MFCFCVMVTGYISLFEYFQALCRVSEELVVHEKIAKDVQIGPNSWKIATEREPSEFLVVVT